MRQNNFPTWVSPMDMRQLLDQGVDLIVLGAGAAGMTAALLAHLKGLKVLLLEKSNYVGGTTSTSAGTIWVPGNRPSLEAGYKDNPSLAKQYMDALIGDADPTGIRQAYLDTAPAVVDFLHATSEVRFIPAGKHPDYRDMPGAAVTGRALAPMTFDGRLLGSDFERVRPPIPEFLVLGGMMVGKPDLAPLIGRFKSIQNFIYSTKLFVRYLFDRTRFSRGTRLTMGNALVARLFYSLKKNRIPILFNVNVDEFLKDDQRIIGVKFQHEEKSYSPLARKGVVLATGGYGHHPDLRKQCMPTPTPRHSVVCPSVTGDGIELATKAGARIDYEHQKPGGFWTPVSITYRKDGSTGLYPHLSLDRAKPGLIAVNQAGRRFVNEASSYHDFVQGMFETNHQEGAIPAYLICEADFVRRYGLGDIYPGTNDLSLYVQSGYIHLEPTLESLAKRLQLNSENLIKTVERHNQFAREGKDLDFGKGDTQLNQFNGDPQNHPNPCLKEIKHGPFVGLQIWPAEIGTSAGLKANGDGQVLNEEGLPIKGLYVCGNDMASMMMGTYPGPGTTLGPAITFAYRVAMHASRIS